MHSVGSKLPRSTFFAALICLLSVATVAAQTAGAATPSQAVAALVGPLATPGRGPSGCNALTGRLDDCPITARLRDRLAHPVAGVETGNLVSRSQNPPQALDVAQVKLPAGATVANVNTRWGYGSGEYTITFVVRQEAGGWLVDDSYCLNNPGSSIYNPPTGPCPMSSSAGGQGNPPGMPSTGAGPGNGYGLPLALAVGALLAGAGLSWMSRRRPRRS